MNQIFYLKDKLSRLEMMRDNLQKTVLDANEKAISEAPIEDRKELYKTHDLIIDFINEQTNMINLTVNTIQKMYSKEYVLDLQNTIKKQKFYIQSLGGNNSIISYIKTEDLC
jgi:uncharacterized protein YqgQ